MVVEEEFPSVLPEGATEGELVEVVTEVPYVGLIEGATEMVDGESDGFTTVG